MSDWEAVAELTGMRKLHGTQGPAPSIEEMVAAFKAELRIQVQANPKTADLVGFDTVSMVSTLVLRVPRPAVADTTDPLPRIPVAELDFGVPLAERYPPKGPDPLEFPVGTWVKLIEPLQGVPAGCVGQVSKVYPTGEAVDVTFRFNLDPRTDRTVKALLGNLLKVQV